jgi:hypothetical protein
MAEALAEKLEHGYRFRDAAPQTQKFMESQSKINTQIEVFMETSKKDIGYIKDALAENTQQHKDIMNSIADLRGFFIKMLLGVGGVAVAIVISYLLIKAGLPGI